MDRAVIYDYPKKRETSLRSFDEAHLKERLFEIKSAAIKNLPRLKSRMVKNLIQNGVEVIEVKTRGEARKAISRIIGSARRVVKSKSNTIRELGSVGSWVGKEVEVTETDLGDFLVNLAGRASDHPVLPALDLDLETIKDLVPTVGIKVLPDDDIQTVVWKVTSFIRKKILAAEVGLTGANALTATGQIVLLENEGNISLVTRVPPVHIVVAGTEKIVPTLEDALHVVRCASIWGTGQELATYVSIISGPSKTADIQNKLVTGASGAREVYLVLVDDWRTRLRGTDFEELLYCIHCGACFNSCPYFVSAGKKLETLVRKKALEFCTLCDACVVNCPARIDLTKLTRRVRAEVADAGRQSKQNKLMLENVKKYGNPFGKEAGHHVPDKLYCC